MPSRELITEKLIKMKEYLDQIAPSTGLRNRLIHEYEEINDAIVFKSIIQTIELYTLYIKEINRFANQQKI